MTMEDFDCLIGKRKSRLRQLKKQEIFRKEGVTSHFPRALKTPKFRYQLQTKVD